MGEMENSYNILVGKSERKRPLGKLKRRWEDNTRAYLREIGWEDVGWVHSLKIRKSDVSFVNMVMNLRVSYKAGNFLTR
jgi:hypothetical protein